MGKVVCDYVVKDCHSTQEEGMENIKEQMIKWPFHLW